MAQRQLYVVALRKEIIMSTYPPLVKQDNLRAVLSADPPRFLSNCRKTHGDVFTLDLPTPVTYMLDPTQFKTLLTSTAVDFTPISQQSKRRFDLDLLVETQEDVRALSQAFVRSLRGSTLKETLVRLESSLKRHVAAFRAAESGSFTVDMQDLVDETLVPASIEALFGSQVLYEGLSQDVRVFSEAVPSRLAGADIRLDPVSRDAEDRLMAAFGNCLYGEQVTPLVASMTEELFADKQARDRSRIRALLMIMWGSLVNLRSSTVWMAAQIFNAPGLADELRAALAKDDTTLAVSVVMETLRLHSRPNIYRAVIEDLPLTLQDGSGVTLPANGWVALFPRFKHHDPATFQDPLVFRPDRFIVSAEDKAAGHNPALDLMIFGTGRGRCPGDGYANAAMLLIMKVWLGQFENRGRAQTELPPAVLQTVSSTPAPAEPIYLTLAHRRQQSGSRVGQGSWLSRLGSLLSR